MKKIRASRKDISYVFKAGNAFIILLLFKEQL